MPSFVIHGVVPALLMMASGRLDRRRVLAALPVTYVPDLDYVVGVHRASLHNVFILVPLAAWLWWEMEEGAGWARAEWAAIGLGYLGSHLAMDAFVGGLSPLWPLTSTAVFVWLAVRVDTATNTPELVWDPGTLSGAPQTAESFLWISPTDAAVLVVVAGAAILTWAGHRLRTSEEGSQDPDS